MIKKLFLLISLFSASASLTTFAAINYFPDKICRVPDGLPQNINPYFQFAVDLETAPPTGWANTLDYSISTTGDMTNISFEGSVDFAVASNFEVADDFKPIYQFKKELDQNPVAVKANDFAGFPTHYAIANSSNGSETFKLILSKLNMYFRNPSSGRTYLIYDSDSQGTAFSAAHTFLAKNDASTAAGSQLYRGVPNKIYIKVAAPKTVSFSGFRFQFGLNAYTSLKCPDSVSVSLYRVNLKSQNPSAAQLVGRLIYLKKPLMGPVYTYELSSAAQLEADPGLTNVDLKVGNGPKITVHTPGTKSDWFYCYQTAYEFPQNETFYSDIVFIDDPSQAIQIDRPQVYFSKGKLNRRQALVTTQ